MGWVGWGMDVTFILFQRFLFVYIKPGLHKQHQGIELEVKPVNNNWRIKKLGKSLYFYTYIINERKII